VEHEVGLPLYTHLPRETDRKKVRSNASRAGFCWTRTAKQAISIVSLPGKPCQATETLHTASTATLAGIDPFG
jgi:hypothetical protein